MSTNWQHDSTEALYGSMFENVLDYVGKDNLLRVQVIPDRQLGSAFIEVTLVDETPCRIDHAIGRLEEVRALFVNELAIDYILLDPKTFTSTTEGRSLTYAAA